MKLTLVTLDEFTFTDDYSYHRSLTCVQHPQMRWFTKNPWARSMFYLPTAEAPIECSCHFSEMRVIVEESQPPAPTFQLSTAPSGGI